MFWKKNQNDTLLLVTYENRQYRLNIASQNWLIGSILFLSLSAERKSSVKRSFTSGDCDRFLWRQLPRSLLGDWWCARVAGVTFSLCSCHDNSTVFRERISVLTTELTTSSLCNQRETLQHLWSSGCNFAPESRVLSSPRNPRQFSNQLHFGAFYTAACTAIACTDEKKNMSGKFSGEVKWPATGIPGIC